MQSTLTAIPNCGGHSGTALHETYIASHRNLVVYLVVPDYPFIHWGSWSSLVACRLNS